MKSNKIIFCDNSDRQTDRQKRDHKSAFSQIHSNAAIKENQRRDWDNDNFFKHFIFD